MVSFKIIKQVIYDGLKCIKTVAFNSRRDRYGYIAPSAVVYQPSMIAKNNVFIYDNCVIHEYARILAYKGRFVMKRNSIAATGLTVIAQNHSNMQPGDYPGGKNWNIEIADDVICEEDVWLGANVTLCPGVHIGRGAIVAAGSICVRTKEYPPYSIIGGNPAQFIKFRFTLEEQLLHEEMRYCSNNRLPVEQLKDNYIHFKTIKHE